MASLTFRAFQPGDEAAFRVLNEAWIKPLFGMEPKDYEVLSDPGQYILRQGGHIFLGLDDDVPVACCALIPHGPDCFELSKMAVHEDRRGEGLGRRLIEHAVSQARVLGAARLYLESNTKLANAVHLYESAGFAHLPADRVEKSPYARSNVHMEMLL